MIIQNVFNFCVCVCFQGKDPGQVDMSQQKRGAAPLLGNLDQKVKDHILAIRAAGGVVNQRIVIAAATGIVKHHDRSLLSEYGGHITLSRCWSESLMRRMGFVRRKGTKAAHKLPDNYADLKADFLRRITEVVSQHSIPAELVLNFDQTAVPIIPISKWTLEKQGSRQVEITGLEDKRQVTTVLCESLNGNLLPPQVIYQGKTDMCHPKFPFPTEWHITHSDNHWSTAQTMQEYVERVIVPYIEEQREALDLPLRHRALVIMDVFRAHRVDNVLEALKSNGIEVIFVPAGCTGELQPLDVSGNAIFKEALASRFNTWYADLVAAGLAKGQSPEEVKVDLRLATLKPLHASWLLHAVDHMAKQREQLQLGWRKAGILSAVEEASSVQCTAL